MRLLLALVLTIFMSLAFAQDNPPNPVEVPIPQGHGQAVGGFTFKLGLIDFFMIQRALMTLPDEHAKATLDSLRAQILEQTKGATPVAPKE